MAEQSARYRERTEDGGDERDGIHKNGRHRIQLVCCPRPGKREETQLSHCLHHLHRWNKRTGCSPSLLCHQTIPKPLLGMPCPASTYAPASISITDLRPGFVATDLIAGSKYPLQLRAEEVARHIVHAIEKGKEVKVIDWRYAILVFFWRHIPRWLWTRLKISQ